MGTTQNALGSIGKDEVGSSNLPSSSRNAVAPTGQPHFSFVWYSDCRPVPAGHVEPAQVGGSATEVGGEAAGLRQFESAQQLHMNRLKSFGFQAVFVSINCFSQICSVSKTVKEFFP